jgi:hypothetical protein
MAARMTWVITRIGLIDRLSMILIALRDQRKQQSTGNERQRGGQPMLAMEDDTRDRDEPRPSRLTYSPPSYQVSATRGWFPREHGEHQNAEHPRRGDQPSGRPLADGELADESALARHAGLTA